MVLSGTSNELIWQHQISIPTETSIATIATDNLMDNAILTFKILISNNDVIEDTYTETTGKDICKLCTLRDVDTK